METILLISLSAVAGAVIAWLIAKSRVATEKQTLKDALQQQLNDEQKLFAAEKASLNAQLESQRNNINEKDNENRALNASLTENQRELSAAMQRIATLKANLDAADSSVNEKGDLINNLSNQLTIAKGKNEEVFQDLLVAKANVTSLADQLTTGKSEIKALNEKLSTTESELNSFVKNLATARADNNALQEKLQRDKQEIEELGKKFNTEFENIANKIFESKTEKFTELNKTNLKEILDPLGVNLNEFKKKVDETYDKEAKERFSLGERVRELAQLNQTIGEEARNLTNALKGEVKTQGRWGEMILERILEKSGLKKGSEYFTEYELSDEDGKPLLSAFEGKKMRPDAVIKYPDNRSVIVDSKVSLNAYIRSVEAETPEDRKRELQSHVQAIKSHIVALSTKGYDDYDQSLDFVMLFIPSEAAYAAVIQAEPEMWNYAYDKRILLISPTNLITSLKLLLDLWKREKHNKNAQEIAKRGTLLYEKLVGFTESLAKVGKGLKDAQTHYDQAYKQFALGDGNAISQVRQLQNLGIRPKKDFSQEVINAQENLTAELLAKPVTNN